MLAPIERQPGEFRRKQIKPAALETIFNEGLKKRSAHNRDQKVGLSDGAFGTDCQWQGLIARSRCVIHQKKP